MNNELLASKLRDRLSNPDQICPADLVIAAQILMGDDPSVRKMIKSFGLDAAKIKVEFHCLIGNREILVSASRVTVHIPAIDSIPPIDIRITQDSVSLDVVESEVPHKTSRLKSIDFLDLLDDNAIVVKDEEQRRDEKRGLYPEYEDPSN